MSNYCIMRMAKIKSRVSLVRVLQHNTRERQPPNADEKRTPENFVEGGTVGEALQKYTAMLPEKVRKNAVHAVEIMMTATYVAPSEQQNYLKSCDEWAKTLFGEQNVLSVAHHYDEKTPHTQIVAIPLKDGKLNAKAFIGGARDRMRELQDDFYEKVGRRFGLERGQPREETRARHTPHTLAPVAAAAEKDRDLWARYRERVERFENALLSDHAELTPKKLLQSNEEWLEENRPALAGYGIRERQKVDAAFDALTGKKNDLAAMLAESRAEHAKTRKELDKTRGALSEALKTGKNLADGVKRLQERLGEWARMTPAALRRIADERETKTRERGGQAR